MVGCMAAASARAQGYVGGMDFVVTHPDTINQVGVYDGGAALTSDETVAVFNAITGDLAGSEVLFGPGVAGTQIGDTFFESVTPFTLAPGEYLVLSIGSGGPVGPGDAGLSGVNAYVNLGGTLDLPGGGRFNSGSVGEVLPNAGSSSQSGGAYELVDPSVPDGATTVALLGGALIGLGWLRRKV